MERHAERLARLIEPVHKRALAFARCLCRSRADGDDLYQDALLRALDKIATLRTDEAFRQWLYRVIITVHRNRCKRAFLRHQVPIGGAADLDDTGNPDLGLLDYPVKDWSPDAARAAERARAALAVLPEVLRETIVLFEIEGWQVNEIAALQRVSTSAVKSRLSRGRARLRAHYVRMLANRMLAANAAPSIVTGDSP